jgi:hypothetical protein
MRKFLFQRSLFPVDNDILEREKSEDLFNQIHASIYTQCGRK